MKVAHFAPRFATPVALMVCLAASSTGQQPPRTDRPPASGLTQRAPVTAGALKRLPANAHYDRLESAGGETVMVSTGHVTPPGPNPGPGGIPIGKIAGGAHTDDPAKLVILLQLDPGQRVPPTLRAQIVDKLGNVLFQTPLACGSCAASRGVLALTLDERAAAAARPYMKDDNLLRLTTSSPLPRPIHLSVGVRSTR